MAVVTMYRITQDFNTYTYNNVNHKACMAQVR